MEGHISTHFVMEGHISTHFVMEGHIPTHFVMEGHIRDPIAALPGVPGSALGLVVSVCPLKLGKIES